MHTRRVTGAAALALALVALAVPTAAARPVVVPAGGQINGEFWKTILEIPGAENPFWGNGDPCVRLGHRGKVLVALAPGGTVSCEAERGTVLMTGWDHYCTSWDVEPEFNAVGRKAQRRCARRLNESVTALTITVDKDTPAEFTVDILKPRFAAFTPLTTVHLPVDNIAGVRAQTGTLTAYGWNVFIRHLDVGRHVITTSVVEGDFSESFEHIIDIVPRRR